VPNSERRRREDGGAEKHYFGGWRSFKVIDVGTTEKLVSSACYDRLQV